MPKCSFKYCKHVTSRTLKKDGISYFLFPRDPIRSGDWIAILSLQRHEEFYRPNNSSVVCSEHFSDEDMYVTDKGITRLRKTAIPRVPIEIKIEPVDGGETKPFSTSSMIHSEIKKELDSPTSIEVPVEGGDSELFNQSSMFNSEITKELNSPTSSVSICSALDTPREAVLKSGLQKCRERLISKEKAIRNLVRKNSRLVKNNILLKNAIKKKIKISRVKYE